jgi:hypothetical protein
MANADRMFQVIVVGGFALAAPLVGTVAGCGSSSSFPNEGPADDAGHLDSSFPHEGAETGGARDTGFPVEGFDAGSRDTGFPVEGLPVPESGVDTGFPAEGPPPPADSGADTGFPGEGPQRLDSGFPQEGPDTGGPADSGREE